MYESVQIKAFGKSTDLGRLDFIGDNEYINGSLEKIMLPFAMF